MHEKEKPKLAAQGTGAPRTPTPPPPRTPPPAASAPPPAPAPDPVAAAPEPPVLGKAEGPAAQPASPPDFSRKVAMFYATLFPPGSPRRRFGPVILAAALVLVLLLGKYVFSSVGIKSPEEVKAARVALEAQTTGRLVVKSNRPDTTIEAMRNPAAGEVAPASVKGADEGAAEQALAGLPAGKYVLTARSAGWPDIRQDMSVDVGRTTEVAVNFKSGSLRLDSDPSGAIVKHGEALLGRTPLVISQLPPGECQVSLEYPAWPALPFKTIIKENVESSETVRLPHGKLTVESTPPGAMVLMGGQAAGQTPLTVERFPAGTRKLTLQANNFPTLELSVTVEDRGEVKIKVPLGSGFPELDPPALLRAVWVRDDPDKLSPQFDTAGLFQPQNGIVKNLNRKRLYENWLRKTYRFSATVKAYDPGKGVIEFDEQKCELAKYRVVAKLSPGARAGKDLAAAPAKGATFEFYGRLSAVEEPRWPLKVITLEISAAEPLR